MQSFPGCTFTSRDAPLLRVFYARGPSPGPVAAHPPNLPCGWWLRHTPADCRHHFSSAQPHAPNDGCRDSICRDTKPRLSSLVPEALRFYTVSCSQDAFARWCALAGHAGRTRASCHPRPHPPTPLHSSRGTTPSRATSRASGAPAPRAPHAPIVRQGASRTQHNMDSPSRTKATSAGSWAPGALSFQFQPVET